MPAARLVRQRDDPWVLTVYICREVGKLGPRSIFSRRCYHGAATQSVYVVVRFICKYVAASLPRSREPYN